jgi:hypothetical protein
MVDLNAEFTFEDTVGDDVEPRERAIVGDFTLQKRIGVGSFCDGVWMATRTVQGSGGAAPERVAIKVIDRHEHGEDKHLRREINLMRHINHPNIVRLYDTLSSAAHIFMVLELCAMDLQKFISRRHPLTLPEARVFMKQLAQAMRQLRRHEIVHRDLKPQNLMLVFNAAKAGRVEDAILKIGDFGLARVSSAATLTKTFCGSPLYMAPEVQPWANQAGHIQYDRAVCREYICRCPMSLDGLECQVSKLVNTDTRPRPTTGPLEHRLHPALYADQADTIRRAARAEPARLPARRQAGAATHVL